MVEDGKKRGRAQRAGQTAAAKTRHGTAVAAADQDAFTAFTSKYRDMLRFADADEAEAVYSMVSLTQAARKQAGAWHAAELTGPVIEVPESRAVKRRAVAVAVPASSACSEGGRSDSSAKSAPGPPPALLHHQQWHSSMHGHQGLAGTPGLQHAHDEHEAAAAAACGQAEGRAVTQCNADIHPGALGPMGPVSSPMNMNMGAMCMNMNMPMFPPFLPPGCMPGMLGGPPGCLPPPPCMPMMPPWALGPAMMFGGLPLPMPPSGMTPFPCMPGRTPVNAVSAAGMAEPAAGIPVSGPLPPAGNAFKAAGAAPAPSSATRSTVSKPSSAGPPAGKAAGANRTPTWPAPAAAAVSRDGAAQAHGTQAAAAAGTHGSDCTPAGGARPTSAAPGAPCSAELLSELEQLDVVSLKPWVVSHFSEDVYLMLLDAWRPDSSKVREAIWSWRLHIRTPRPGGTQPDIKAFLVSLFGLEVLSHATTVAAAAAQPPEQPDSGQQASPPVVKAVSSPAHSAPLQPPVCEPAAAAAEPGSSGAYQLASRAAEEGAAHPQDTVAAGCVPREVHCERDVGCGGDCNDGAITTSNLSSEPGAALTAPGPHVMNILLPSTAAGNRGASATSPHKPAAVQLQLPLSA